MFLLRSIRVKIMSRYTTCIWYSCKAVRHVHPVDLSNQLSDVSGGFFSPPDASILEVSNVRMD